MVMEREVFHKPDERAPFPTPPPVGRSVVGGLGGGGRSGHGQDPAIRDEARFREAFKSDVEE